MVPIPRICADDRGLREPRRRDAALPRLTARSNRMRETWRCHEGRHLGIEQYPLLGGRGPSDKLFFRNMFLSHLRRNH